MTQQEAEGLKQILKRRRSEEVSLIEQKWESERKKLEADRKHSLDRMHEKLGKLQQDLVNAKEESHKAQNTEKFFDLKRKEKEITSQLRQLFYEIGEMNRYYQEEFKALRDKRDDDLRKLNQRHCEERARIDLQVERKPKEEQLNYWKQKFYKTAEELKKVTEDLQKLKETNAA